MHERTEQTGHLRNFAQRWPAQRSASRGDERGQIASRQVQSLAECLSLLALEFNQPMWDVILVEKIVELMALARVAQRNDAQPGELAVATEPPPAHDESVHNRLAHTGELGERAADFDRRNFQNFRLFRLHARTGQRGRALEHCDVADEIALSRCGENLFRAFACFKNFDFATQNNR